MGLRPTNSDENHVGRASTPAAGLQTRLFPKLRRVFDCARVLQDPLLRATEQAGVDVRRGGRGRPPQAWGVRPTI